MSCLWLQQQKVPAILHLILRVESHHHLPFAIGGGGVRAIIGREVVGEGVKRAFTEFCSLLLLLHLLPFQLLLLLLPQEELHTSDLGTTHMWFVPKQGLAQLAWLFTHDSLDVLLIDQYGGRVQFWLETQLCVLLLPKNNGDKLLYLTSSFLPFLWCGLETTVLSHAPEQSDHLLNTLLMILLDTIARVQAVEEQFARIMHTQFNLKKNTGCERYRIHQYAKYCDQTIKFYGLRLIVTGEEVPNSVVEVHLILWFGEVPPFVADHHGPVKRISQSWALEN